MTRRKKEKQKPGKKSWVFGTKLDFFTRYQVEWETAQAAGRDKAGHFYTLITTKYLVKYGNLPSMEDLAEDVPDPEDDNLDLGWDELDEAELELRQKEFSELRQRISQWYRTHFSGVSRSNASLLQQVLENFRGDSSPKPKRPSDLAQFSKMYYGSMIKLEYEKDLELAKAAYQSKLAEYKEQERLKAAREGDDGGEDQPEDEAAEAEQDEKPKPPVRVNICRLTTCRLWEAQTDEFRAQVRERAVEAHSKAVKEWEEQQKSAPAKSAEQYDRALRDLYQVVKDFADGIHVEFGMAVSILLCGPVGRSNGAINVRSIHVGETLGTKLNWPQFDPVGYQVVEQTLTKFGMKVFSPAECAARILGPDAAIFPSGDPWDNPPVTNLNNAASADVSAGIAGPGNSEDVSAHSSRPRRQNRRAAEATQVREESGQPLAPTLQPRPRPRVVPRTLLSQTVHSPPPADVMPRRAVSVVPKLTVRATFLVDPPAAESVDQPNTAAKAQRAGSLEPISSRKDIPVLDFLPKGYFPRPRSHLADLLHETVLSPPAADVVARRASSVAPKYSVKAALLVNPPKAAEAQLSGSVEPPNATPDVRRARSLEPICFRMDVPAPDFLPNGYFPRPCSLIQARHHSSPPNPAPIAVSPLSDGCQPDMTSPQTETPSQPVDSSSLPDDFSSFHPELQAALLEFQKGSEWEGWQELVEHYLDYEREGGYVEDGKALRADGKPDVLSIWYKNHRKIAEIPNLLVGTVGDLTEWNEEWKTWWANMQPDDRIDGDTISGRPDRVDWGPLKLAFGKKGLWPVILTLFWWGHVSNVDGGQARNPGNWLNWKLACDDVTWALGSLIENGLKPLAKAEKSRKKDDAKLKGKKQLATSRGITAPSRKRRHTELEPIASTSTPRETRSKRQRQK